MLQLLKNTFEFSTSFALSLAQKAVSLPWTLLHKNSSASDPQTHRIQVSERSSNMSQDIQAKIKEVVEGNKVVVFMKGVPEAPQCGFSAQTIQVLKAAGAPIVGIDVLANPAVRNGIKEFTNWPTIPQVFINGKFIGGCDIVTEMYERGELKPLVDEALKN